MFAPNNNNNSSRSKSGCDSCKNVIYLYKTAGQRFVTMMFMSFNIHKIVDWRRRPIDKSRWSNRDSPCIYVYIKSLFNSTYCLAYIWKVVKLLCTGSWIGDFLCRTFSVISLHGQLACQAHTIASFLWHAVILIGFHYPLKHSFFISYVDLV